MITLILGVFHHICKSARSASRQRENFMESLHSDGSATCLLIIFGRKNYTFRNEIETKTISLNCFSKYICELPTQSTFYLSHVAQLNSRIT